VHFFVFLAHPKPTSKEYGAVDSAYVSCWVNEAVPSVAELVARTLVNEIGWDVDELEDAHPITENHYAVDDSGREYAEQARVDGIVATLHTWHIGADE
jgi:hypothetical protein